MPEDSSIHGHLSATPKSHKFESSLNLVFKFMRRVSSVLVMVTDRWYSADFKVRCFLVSFHRYPEYGRSHGTSLAGAGVLCDSEAVLLRGDDNKDPLPYYCKKKKGQVHPCTGTEALYRPYGP